MSLHETEVPAVAVKSGKMFNYWSTKMKVCVAILVLGIYVYIILFIKTVYMRSKRLDRIMSVATETKQMIQNIHNLDDNLAANLEVLDKFYEDY